jgi:hypothetical protein
MTIYRCDLECKKGGACYFPDARYNTIKNDRCNICNHKIKIIIENLKDNQTDELVNQNSRW